MFKKDPKKTLCPLVFYFGYVNVCKSSFTERVQIKPLPLEWYKVMIMKHKRLLYHSGGVYYTIGGPGGSDEIICKLYG